MSEIGTIISDGPRKRNNSELDKNGSDDCNNDEPPPIVAHDTESEDGSNSLPPTKRNKLNMDFALGDIDLNSNMEVRFLVSSKDAGAIIGRAGSNISNLRKVYDASITVPDCPSPERVLTINATIEKLSKIARHVLDFMETVRSSKHNSAGKGKKPETEAKNAVTGVNESELRLLLHTSHAGGLIGKGGSRITQLREETKANIKIFSDYCPQSSERVCAISGAPDLVANAVKLILCLIKSLPTRGSVVPYHPSNYDAFTAPRYGGFSDPSSAISAVPGSGSFGARASYYPTPPIPPPHYAHQPPPPPPPTHPYSSANRIPTISDAALTESGASSVDYSSASFFPQWSSTPGYRMGYGRTGTDIGDAYATDASWFQGNKNWFPKASNNMLNRNDLSFINNLDGSATATITVSNKVVGAIIGKGGHRIKEIRNKSKAEISVGQNTSPSSNRVITVKGFVTPVQTACQLICKWYIINNPCASIILPTQPEDYLNEIVSQVVWKTSDFVVLDAAGHRKWPLCQKNMSKT